MDRRLTGKRLLLVVFLLGVVFGLTSCIPGLPVTWTLIAYLDGDTNLELFSVQDLNWLEGVGSTDRVNIVALLDRAPDSVTPPGLEDRSNGDWKGCKAFYVTKDPNGFNIVTAYPWTPDWTIVSQEISLDTIGISYGADYECDMGDPNTLSAFVNWAKSSYPATHYMLIIEDHGAGVLLSPPKILKGTKDYRLPKGVAFDFTDTDDLTTPDLKTALAKTGYVDIVGFDACLMGSVEIAYEMAPYVGYMIGSEESQFTPGWDYGGLASYLTSNPSVSPAQLASEQINIYKNFWTTVIPWKIGWIMQAATDLSEVKGHSVGKTLDDLAVFLMDNFYKYKAGMKAARWSLRPKLEEMTSGQSLLYSNYIDLYQYIDLLEKQYPTDAELGRYTRAVKGALDAAVINEWHMPMTDYPWLPPHPYVHGLTIYFPCTDWAWDVRWWNGAEWANAINYDTDITMSLETNWNDLLGKYYCEEYCPVHRGEPGWPWCPPQ